MFSPRFSERLILKMLITACPSLGQPKILTQTRQDSKIFRRKTRFGQC